MKNSYIRNNGFTQLFLKTTIYLSILAIVFICGVCTKSEVEVSEWGEVSTLYVIDIIIGLSVAKKLILLCSSFSAVTGFCQDWNSKYIQFLIIRKGINRYIVSKILVCFISTFIVSFAGIMTFCIGYTIKSPIYSLEDEVEPWGYIGGNKIPVLYLLVIVLIFSMSCAVWSVIGLTISSYIPNKFVALISPIVASYIIEGLSYSLPSCINMNYLSKASVAFDIPKELKFMYILLVFVAITIIAGLLFRKQVKRRLGNEIV